MEVPMRPRRRSRRREYGSREKRTEVCRAHARRLGLVGQAICPTFARLLPHVGSRGSLVVQVYVQGCGRVRERLAPGVHT